MEQLEGPLPQDRGGDLDIEYIGYSINVLTPCASQFSHGQLGGQLLTKGPLCGTEGLLRIAKYL